MDDRKKSNPKDKIATTRLDLSLFPASARAYGALAMVEGDLKYGGYNYREAGVQASVYYAAANRHLDKWFNGEWSDQKTGVPHLASAIACIAVLIDAVECGKMFDNRPPKCDMALLLNKMEDKVAHLQKLFHDGPGRYTEIHNKEAVSSDNILNRDEIIKDNVCDRDCTDFFDRSNDRPEKYG
jgi:hypothetical protein